jgi:membrane protein
MLDSLPRPFRRALRVGTATYTQWRMHRTIRLGAAIAYYGLFALVPVLAVCLAVAGRLVADDQVQAYVDERLVDVFGPQAEQFSAAVAATLGSTGTIAGLGLIGAGTLVLAATLLVISLQDALNTIWELPVVAGLRHSFFRRLGAFVVILAAGGVLVLAFAINSITAVIDRLVPDVVILESMTELFGAAASWALGVGVFVLLFRYLPDSRVPWRASVIGGAVTTLLVVLGTTVIGFYLRHFGATSIPGAAGGVALILLWMYYEAQIVLVGAEFTRVMTLDDESLTRSGG